MNILYFFLFCRVKSQISREGLGLKGNSYTTRQMKVKCQKLFKDFLKTDMQNDIVFLDFTSEERAIIHQYVLFKL